MAEPPPPKGVSSEEWDKLLQVMAPKMKNKVAEMREKEAVSGKWVYDKMTKAVKGADSRRLQKAVHKLDLTGRGKSKIRNAKATLAKDIAETERRKRPSLNQLPKLAAQQAFEELTAEPDVDGMEAIYLHKVANCSDPHLFKIAHDLSSSIEEALEIYEGMGGTFEKVGFGAPIFSAPQMAGSPAVSAGQQAKAAPSATPTGMSAPMSPAGGMVAPKIPAPPAAQAQQGGTPMTTTTTTKQVVAPAAPAQQSSSSSSSGV